jgi:hypothetical protein
MRSTLAKAYRVTVPTGKGVTYYLDFTSIAGLRKFFQVSLAHIYQSRNQETEVFYVRGFIANPIKQTTVKAKNKPQQATYIDWMVSVGLDPEPAMRQTQAPLQGKKVPRIPVQQELLPDEKPKKVAQKPVVLNPTAVTTHAPQDLIIELHITSTGAGNIAVRTRTVQEAEAIKLNEVQLDVELV